MSASMHRHGSESSFGFEQFDQRKAKVTSAPAMRYQRVFGTIEDNFGD